MDAIIGKLFNIVSIVEEALKRSGKNVIVKDYTVSIKGEIIWASKDIQVMLAGVSPRSYNNDVMHYIIV